MIDARVFTENLGTVRRTIKEEQAELRGFYSIHDTIFRNKDTSIPLAKEFLRFREVPENIWDEEPFILALKQTTLREVGKHSDVPFKLEFEKREDALGYFDEHLSSRYSEDFDFWRVGWQYILPNGDVIDLEIIEDRYPSIEFKSESDEGLRKLLGKFAVQDISVIAGPSVIAVKELLLAA